MSDPVATPQPAKQQKIDTSVPHSARIWNYWLGGKDNYPVDEAAGDPYTEVFPGIVTIARSSRGFLRRNIAYLVSEAGIRQFLDVGTGLPTAQNTHEVAELACRARESSTSTTIRWCSPTPVRCSPPPRRVRPPTSTRT